MVHYIAKPKPKKYQIPHSVPPTNFCNFLFLGGGGAVVPVELLVGMGALI